MSDELQWTRSAPPDLAPLQAWIEGDSDQRTVTLLPAGRDDVSVVLSLCADPEWTIEIKHPKGAKLDVGAAGLPDAYYVYDVGKRGVGLMVDKNAAGLSELSPALAALAERAAGTPLGDDWRIVPADTCLRDFLSWLNQSQINMSS